MPLLRAYWSWLGRRLRLSRAGRAVLTAALLAGAALIVVAWVQGAREGGAPLVVLVLVAAGVIAGDAVVRGVAAALRRR